MNFLESYLGMIKAVAVAIVALALFGIGFKTGAAHVQAKWTADQIALAQAAEAERSSHQQRINELEAKAAKLERSRIPTEKVIIQQVEKYVPIDSPMLPPGFRLQHDSAATGQEIDDSRAADAAPVAARTVATTLTSNYAIAREQASDLEELQAIIRASGCFEIPEN